MPKFAKALWKGPIPNETHGGITRPILGLVLHVEQGTEAGTDAWFHNPRAQASAHFGNPQTGPLEQWVDTDDKAWAEVAGNSNWVSVEHEGYSGRAPTPTASQVENDAQLLAWLHKTEGVPLQATDSVSKRGLGWHGMGGAAWGGHTDCPGPLILDARPQIIARAKVIVAAPKPPRPRGFPVRVRVAYWIVTRWLEAYNQRAAKGPARPLATVTRDKLHRLVTDAQTAEKAGAK
jgi:hypothetical protein